MIAAKIYPLTIPANGSFPLLASGDFFKVLSATSTFEVTGDTFGGMGAIQPGQGLENTPFQRLTFRDTSGSPNVLSVLVAGDKFIDDRITGEVSVIDGEKARTLAGGMYSATPVSVAVAAQYPFVQLWNPAGSGKNLIVTQLGVSIAGGAATGFVHFKAAALPTDQTAARASNKKAGVGLGVGQVRSDSNVAVETFALGMLWTAVLAAGGQTPWPIKGAIVVPPGFGLNATSTLVNLTLQGVYEWFEENV